MTPQEYLKSKGSVLTPHEMQAICVVMQEYADYKTELLKSELEQTTLIAKTKTKQVEVLKEKIRILNLIEGSRETYIKKLEELLTK